MPHDALQHGHACDCDAHRALERAARTNRLLSATFPVVACAFCPACLTMYAKLFSLTGVGFGFSELHHLAVLAVALSVNIGVSAWRSLRSQRVWPIVVALAGSALVATGHAAGSVLAVEWAGLLLLLGGGLAEHLGLRRQGGGALGTPLHARS